MLCGIYDMKNNEQCVGIFDKVEDAAKYLGIKKRKSLFANVEKAIG